jgi:hypothetical protein
VLGHLNGMAALALRDRTRGECPLARAPSGGKPLHLAWTLLMFEGLLAAKAASVRPGALVA